MKQHEIDFGDKDIEDYYMDQSPINGAFVSSVYTPYGIGKIDAQYCALIRNINYKVKDLFKRDRRREILISPRTGKEFEGNYQTFYDPINLDDKYCEVKVVWENGETHEFLYGEKPVFDVNTRKTDPNQLMNEIINIPNLHIKIKENLLDNLKNYLKENKK